MLEVRLHGMARRTELEVYVASHRDQGAHVRSKKAWHSSNGPGPQSRWPVNSTGVQLCDARVQAHQVSFIPQADSSEDSHAPTAQDGCTGSVRMAHLYGWFSSADEVTCSSRLPADKPGGHASTRCVRAGILSFFLVRAGPGLEPAGADGEVRSEEEPGPQQRPIKGHGPQAGFSRVRRLRCARGCASFSVGQPHCWHRDARPHGDAK